MKVEVLDIVGSKKGFSREDPDWVYYTSRFSQTLPSFLSSFLCLGGFFKQQETSQVFAEQISCSSEGALIGPLLNWSLPCKPQLADPAHLGPSLGKVPQGVVDCRCILGLCQPPCHSDRE